MNKETNKNKDMTISKEAFGILAFLLGILGIHDFAARRFLYGCGHLILFIVAIILFRIGHTSFLPPTLIVGSWVWAIIENIAYQKSGIDPALQNEKIKKKMDAKGFLAFAKAAEVFTCLAIISGIFTIIMTIQSRKMVCDSTSCGWGKGLMIALPILIDVFMIIMSVVFSSIALMQRKDFSAEQKCAKDVSYHTKVIIILDVSLIIAILFAISVLCV